MKAALDIVMAWQLRNPGITDPAAAIEEVKASDVVDSTPETNGHVAKRQKKGELTSTLVSHFLRETLKPFFSIKANPEITAAGRKRIGAHQRYQDPEFGDESVMKPWKTEHNRWVLELLLWCCKSVDKKSLEREWGFVIPPLLAVFDDTDTRVRVKGCEMLIAMLGNCPHALLKRTGLAPLFEESLYASVTSLPSLTPEEESIVLLDAALPALLALTDASYPPVDESLHDPARQMTLDTVFRKAVLQPYSHAGEHVRIAEVLMEHLPAILQTMGIDSVKHLKDLVPILSNILSDPLGPGYPPLLLAAARATHAVIGNTWPRILEWKGEVLRGVAICWIRLDEEGGDIDDKALDELKKELRTVADMFRTVVEAQEGGTVSWKEYTEKLVVTDERLEQLFT
jgi:tRNA nucleotidyltransferase (CCA-adding enzyme)